MFLPYCWSHSVLAAVVSFCVIKVFDKPISAIFSVSFRTRLVVRGINM